MKKLFFLTALIAVGLSAKAQLYVTNNTACDVVVNIRALSIINGFCSDVGGTNLQLMPAQSVTLPASPGVDELEISVIIDPNGTSGMIGVIGCTGLCGGWPTKGSDPACGGTIAETTPALPAGAYNLDIY